MSVFAFGDFWIDTENRRLWSKDGDVDLIGTPFALLAHLVEQSADAVGRDDGPLVTKADLLQAVWQDAHVTDETVRSTLRQIRRALGDDPQAARYIKTQSKQGWRFVSSVAEVSAQSVRPRRSLQPPGGPYDPKWYVTRPQEEQEMRSCISYPGRPVVVYGPQGAGKSSLINHALEHAIAQKGGTSGARVARISFRSFTDEQLASLDSMLHEVGRQLLDPTDEYDESVQATLTKMWNKKLEPQLKLKRLIKNHVLKDGQIIYWVLTDFDALLTWRHLPALCDILRVWQDAEDLASLRLVIESAVPPRFFPLSAHSPFWTKAARIHVAELDDAQLGQLAQLYGLTPPLSACHELRELVGGLPSLCREALYRAAMRDISLEELLRESRSASDRFAVFIDHLQDLQQWLEYRSTSTSAPPGRKDPLQSVRDAREGVTLSSEEAWPLIRKGLLRETEPRGMYRLRCKLYEEFFSRPSA